MPGIYEYTIIMQDRTSGTLKKLTGSSYEAVQTFVGLQEKMEALQRSSDDFGNSIYTLKQKVDILQQERDLIDPSNLNKIRQYNKEIADLTTRINNLENISGGKFKTWTKDAFSQIPGAGLLTNPIVMAGAGVTAVGKLGVSWEEGMAKINATAQLPQKELDRLSRKIKQLGIDAGAKNLNIVPDAYEKILSQTGNVALSTDILDKALKGAKAGFTEINLVAGATAQSLSAIGKENTNAQEVLDTLFAAKRVGAGEFADFARYLPTLFAGGKNIGAQWKETAGLFAYMTGKGQESGQSAMYIQNAFNALGKGDITGGLAKAGVKVFDDSGKMRDMLDIFTDLSKLTRQMTDQQKSDFLEKIGLRDQQAKAAFSILTDETQKLKAAIDATANASGELQNALDNTNNTGNKLREGWAKIQGIGLSLSEVVITVLNPVLDVLGGLLSGISSVIDWVGSAWNWWMNLLQEGNPWIVGLTVLIGSLTTALMLHNLWLKRDAIWTGIVTVAKGTWAAITGVATGAMWGLNAAMLANPVTWIVAGVMALVAAFIAAWKYSEKFRGAITGVWEVIKGFGVMLKEFVVDRIKDIISGLGGMASAIGKLFKGDFKGAVEDGKKALSDLAGIDALKNAVNSGKELGNKFRTGYQKGVEGFAKSKEKGEGSKSLLDKILPQQEPTKTIDFNSILSKLGKNGSGKKGGSDSLSLGIPQNYNHSGSYAAITSNIRKMAAAVAVPVALTVGAASASLDSVASGLEPSKTVSIDNQSRQSSNGKTIHIDRFTDKIEIHVTGQDAPQEVAEQIRTEVEKALEEIFNV